MLELLPELSISEEQGKILTEDGWYFQDHIETEDELDARVKHCMQMFKDIAMRDDMRGKTVFAIGHGYFLNSLLSFLLGG